MPWRALSPLQTLRPTRIFLPRCLERNQLWTKVFRALESGEQNEDLAFLQENSFCKELRKPNTNFPSVALLQMTNVLHPNIIVYAADSRSSTTTSAQQR